MKLHAMALAALLAVSGPAFADKTPAPEGAAVYFVNVSDGDTLSAPVTVFSLSVPAWAWPLPERTRRIPATTIS